MAEENDLSRTEPASAQRLQNARRAGDVPRSAELSAWLVLLAGLGGLVWLAPRLLDTLASFTRLSFQQAAQSSNPLAPESPLYPALAATLWATLPLLVLMFVVALLAPILFSGWTASSDAARVQWTRASPLKPLSRLFSQDGWVDAVLTLLKFVLVMAAVGWAAWPDGVADASSGFAQAAAWLGQTLLTLVAVLALTAALDAGWRWWRYLRRHAMTWQEVLAEARESEVSPEMRARLRARQQQAGQGAAGGGPPPGPEGANARPQSVDEVIG